MSELLETIVQKIETFQRLECWKPQQIVQNSTSIGSSVEFQQDSSQHGAFSHFLNEWCSHLESPGPVKRSIFSGWNQSHDWKTPALENASLDLFRLGSKEEWTDLWKALQSQTEGQPLLDICNEILEWGKACLDQDSIFKYFTSQKSAPQLERRVLGVLPYKSGILSLVLVQFPTKGITPLHSHPECLAEVVLSGEIVEFRFSPQSKASIFRYETMKVLGPGDKTLSLSKGGTPHMMSATSKNVVCLAVFAGARPIEYFPRQNIENPADLAAAISTI